MRRCQTCKKQSDHLNCCSMCKQVFYCSRSCQKMDWLRHKSSCTSSSSSSSSSSKRTSQVSRAKDGSLRKPVVAVRKAAQPVKVKPVAEVETKYQKLELIREDVPVCFEKFVYLTNQDDTHTNLLILLPGMGNDFEQYVTLAKNLNIPQCCYLILQGPIELPFQSGYCWYPVFDAGAEFIKLGTQERRRLSGLKRSRRWLYKLFEVLLAKYKWQTKNIFLLGFSQGASMAIDCALHSKALDPVTPFGGVMAISDSIFDEAMIAGYVEPYPELPKIPKTLPPLLLTHGIRDQRNSLITAKEKCVLLNEIYQRTQGDNSAVEFNTFDKGHQMISSKQEAESMFKFFSKYMELKNIAVESLDGVIPLN